MNRYAIIVAGGIGSRMGADQPKQFLSINNKPILVYTLEKFLALPELQIILTLPSDHINTWKQLQQQFLPDADIQVIPGGETRFHSVKNGLDVISDLHGIVAIHDGVRPFISPEIIEKGFTTASMLKAAVVSVPLKDSIRYVDGNKSESKNRKDYYLIQTPQTFDLELLKQAFLQEYEESFTDDASVFEAEGFEVHLIEGDYKNIKITTQEDLIIAEAFLK